jgi:hypothetical protein
VQTGQAIGNRVAQGYNTARAGGENKAGAAVLGLLLPVADTVGVTNLNESYVGTELITNRQLSGAERVQKGIVGSVYVGITGATICGLRAVAKRGVPKAPEGGGPRPSGGANPFAGGVPPNLRPIAPATPLPTRAPHPSTGRPPQSPLSRPFSTDLEPGTYVYVQDANGVVRVVPNAPSAHPTVLGSGQPAAAAGELTVGPGGVITELNNISYTFQFGGDVLTQVAAAIEQVGATIAPNAIKPFTH